MSAPDPPGHDLVVVGASAGGVHTLAALAEALPAGLPAAVAVVQHLSPQAPSMLDRILDRRSPLPVQKAADGEPVEPGRVVVAVPDLHLLVEDGASAPGGRYCLVRGPSENRSRPSIDVLFRSAAVAFGPRVVGVLLTGMLDDGVAGLASIKACGGVTVVQDPDEALYPQMPANALARVDVDHRLPVAEISRLIGELARQTAGPARRVPEALRAEVEIAKHAMDHNPSPSDLGAPSPFICPECGGTLYEVNGGDVRRYRCHVGHAYTAQTLLAGQDDSVEQALWAAMRAMVERATMLERMGEDERRHGRDLSSAQYAFRAAESRRHAERLLRLVQHGEHATTLDTPEDA